jgi:hypothetical protein
MARATAVFIILLTIIATLLFGINLGKIIKSYENKTKNLPTPTIELSPTATLHTPTPDFSPTPSSTPSATPKVRRTPTPTSKPVSSVKGITTYRNETCGFSFSYPGSYIKQNQVNEKSIILVDEKDPQNAIITTCAKDIPTPDVAEDEIETVVLDGEKALLYHDKTPDGAPRDDVIVKHPSQDFEIIIAGYGDIFQEILSSFKFI